MSPEEEIHRASRAQEIIQNEIYIEAFSMIEQELTDQWKQSPVRDAEGREKLWLMLRLLGKVKLALEYTMDSGKLAKAELNHRQTVVERANEWLNK